MSGAGQLMPAMKRGALTGAGWVRDGKIVTHRKRFTGIVGLIIHRAGPQFPQGLTSDQSGASLVDELLQAQSTFRSLVLDERNQEITHSQTGEISLELDEAVLEQTEHVFIPVADPPIWYQLRRAATRVSRPVVTASRILVGSLLAGGFSLAFSLGRPDWAIVTVVIMLALEPSQRAGTVKGLHRTIGTVFGLALYFAIWSLNPNVWVILFVVAICQGLAELFIVRNYAITVTFTTPLALIIGTFIHTQSLEVTLVGRIIEVFIAVALGIAVLWWVFPKGVRRVYRSVTSLALHWTQVVLHTLPDTESTQALSGRRILRYELSGTANAALDAANDDPKWMKTQWAHHHAIQDIGFKTLSLASPTAGSRVSSKSVEEYRTIAEQLPEHVG